MLHTDSVSCSPFGANNGVVVLPRGRHWAMAPLTRGAARQLATAAAACPSTLQSPTTATDEQKEEKEQEQEEQGTAQGDTSTGKSGKSGNDDNSASPSPSVELINKGLRRALPAQDLVWKHRKDCDVYTQQPKKCVAKPQVDHVIEVQLAEYALVSTYMQPTVRNYSAREREVATEQLRNKLTAIPNLNVTSLRINQAKRGPHTAALNRLRGERELRGITLEQLARQGRARWLVDDGTWAAIEKAMCASYDELVSMADATDTKLGKSNTGGVARNTQVLLDSVHDTLADTLSKLGVL